MRCMQKVIHGKGGEGLEVPSISKSTWFKQLTDLLGREATPAEKNRADKMAAKGWTLKVVVDALKDASNES